MPSFVLLCTAAVPISIQRSAAHPIPPLVEEPAAATTALAEDVEKAFRVLTVAPPPVAWGTKAEAVETARANSPAVARGDDAICVRTKLIHPNTNKLTGGV